MLHKTGFMDIYLFRFKKDFNISIYCTVYSTWIRINIWLKACFMLHLFSSNLAFNACIPVQGITVKLLFSHFEKLPNSVYIILVGYFNLVKIFLRICLYNDVLLFYTGKNVAHFLYFKKISTLPNEKYSFSC